jgi:glutamate synthase (NADPH/NADH) small chain
MRLRDSTFVVPCDLAVVAHGYIPDPFLRDTTPGLETDDRHHLIVDEQTGRTTRRGVYAGGDGVHGASLVVNAIAAGKRVAAAIDAYLSALPVGAPPPALPAPSGGEKKGKKKRWFRR